jgi:hypothetical protein
VLLSLILGGFFGIGGAFVKALLRNAEKDKEEYQKLEELKTTASLTRWRNLVGI